MRGNYDMFRSDLPAFGHRSFRRKLPYCGILVNIQSFRYGGYEFQRVELRLTGVFHRAGNRERKRDPGGKLRPPTQSFQRRYLFLYLPAVINGINIGILFLKIAIHAAAQPR